MVDLLIRGNILLPEHVAAATFIAIDKGVIVEIGNDNPPAAVKVIDYGTDYILPGAIDAQVHSRSQLNQEGFGISTRSAAAGGVTTIVDMPYDAVGLICNDEALKAKILEVQNQAVVDVALYGTIPADGNTSQIQPMIDEGVIGFKFSSFGTDPKRFPRIAPHHLYEAMSIIGPSGLISAVHNENDEVVRYMTEYIKAKGITDYRAHNLSRPVYSENIAIAEFYELGVAAGCRTHIVHCSNPRGYDICESYRNQGYDTTIEACLHYLFLNEDEHVSTLGGVAKVNPPIRNKKAMMGLWEKLSEGAISIVSTDHVSWSKERKTHKNIFDNSSGVPGLDILYPLLIKGCLDRQIPIQKAIQLLAEAPAKLFNIHDRKGSLEVGKHADIVVMAKQPGAYDPSGTRLNAVDWSPYQGIVLPYTVKHTYVRGQLVFDGRIKMPAGSGKFIKPNIE